MGEKILKLLITDIFIYLFSFIFVYIGFNLLLPLVFAFIPKLSCGKVFSSGNATATIEYLESLKD